MLKPADVSERTQSGVPPLPEFSALQKGIVAALAYADIFDYPLTAVEIHRNLVGIQAMHQEVEQALHGPVLIPRYIEHHNGYYTLPNRSAIVEIRLRHAALSAALWPRAIHYGRWLARIPFVRMVAVTGALAVDNVVETDDMDYLIVTEPGYLWLCRALVILLVKWARLRGHVICPNFFLSQRDLHIAAHNPFSAFEIVHMVPLAGQTAYEQMLADNDWAVKMMPNTDGAATRFEIVAVDGHFLKDIAEKVLRTPVGRWLEHWEMNRKVAKFKRQQRGLVSDEIVFTADRCQGHFDRHGSRTIEAFEARLKRIEGNGFHEA